MHARGKNLTRVALEAKGDGRRALAKGKQAQQRRRRAGRRVRSRKLKKRPSGDAAGCCTERDDGRRRSQEGIKKGEKSRSRRERRQKSAKWVHRATDAVNVQAATRR